MNETLLQLFRDCVIRVNVAPGLFGSAFFVGQDLAVTCAHVVGGRRSVEVGWRGTDHEAEVVSVAGDEHEDVSLLRCKFAYHPAVLLEPGTQIADALVAHGFSTRYPLGDDVTLVFEGFSTTQHGRLLKLKGGQLEPGFSGAPLLNLESLSVVGMIRTTRDRAADLGGRAISASVLLHVPEIADANWRWHLSNRAWSDAAVGSVAVGGASDLLSRAGSSYLSVSLTRLASRFVAGSERVRLSHLFGSSRLLGDFRWRTTDSKTGPPADLLAYLYSQTSSTQGQRSLILADPGLGKSTLLAGLFWRAAAAWQRGDVATIPILIDARDYVGLKEFGTAAWLTSHYERISGTETTPTQIAHLADAKANFNSLLLVDSLDEYLAGLTPVEAERELTKPLFREAQILACRAQFFDRFLARGTFAETLEKIDLLPWDWENIEKYVRCYLQEFGSSGDSRVDELVDRLAELPLLDLCKVPLRLNMILDVWGGGDTEVASLSSLATLYSEYLFSWLSREAGRPGSVLTTDEKLHFLREVSWRSYEYSGGQGAARLTRDELGRIVGSLDLHTQRLDVILDDLQYRTIFIHDPTPFITGEGTLTFAHKSFQEFLVAAFLFDLLMTGSDRSELAFQTPITPEVSDFLKEMIAGANQDPIVRERVVRGAVRAFERNVQARHADSTGEIRLARQQLAYYLGNLQSTAAVAFLRKRLAVEDDPFTRRGIIIGLAFGGSSTLLDEYVASLRAARASGTKDALAEATVNIGFHLSFFGDQSFDVRCPERDQGLPFCEKAVRRLTYQLGTSVDRASWRLNLFTLVDLANRLSSRENYMQAIRECKPDLDVILHRLEEEPTSRSWPEVAELRQILNALNPSESEGPI